MNPSNVINAGSDAYSDGNVTALGRKGLDGDCP